MKLSESQLRSIIRQELQEMMTPEFGEDGGEKDKYQYGSKLGFKFDEESESKSDAIANKIVEAFNELKQNPQLSINVASLVRSEGHKELAMFIKTMV
jgi:hypothetical protein